MSKRIIFIFSLLFLFTNLYAETARFKPGTLPLVDGVYNSTQTIISNRQPVFSWEMGSSVSSFTITVSADNVFDPSGELWNCTGSTTTANTINYITRVAYNGATPLSAGQTYFWQVTIYCDGTSATASGQFSTIASAATLSRGKFDLAVDWNNPFNPATGQVTRFRFTAKDRDRRVQVRVFTISGELVRDWPEQTILKDAVYTVDWDGKNRQGEMVARGIYFVNLMDVGEATGVTKRLAVIK
jgi:hypothetical protein